MKGSYCIIIRVGKTISIPVGSLGVIEFKTGYYAYIGSALNGLEKRIGRHISVSRGESRTKHWHIDYLLSSPDASIENVYYKESGVREECMISEKVREFGSGIRFFGCSDCRCRAHLYRIGDTVWFNENMLEHRGEQSKVPMHL